MHVCCRYFHATVVGSQTRQVSLSWGKFYTEKELGTLRRGRRDLCFILLYFNERETRLELATLSLGS